MNWTYLFHPGTYLRMRTRRRQVVKLLAYSGCLRSASCYIRYGMTEQDLDTLLYTKETHETDPQS